MTKDNISNIILALFTLLAQAALTLADLYKRVNRIEEKQRNFECGVYWVQRAPVLARSYEPCRTDIRPYGHSHNLSYDMRPASTPLYSR